MKLSIPSITLLFALAVAKPHYERGPTPWSPPGKGDGTYDRGPCPMMNTLANHEFLPHDGKGITKELIVDGLSKALNFDPSLAELMFEMAIVANPEPNATYFTLDHLNRHNVLEHDASLSRTDDFFGSNHVFNQTIFDETREYWTGSVLDAAMLANGKVARQIDSKAFNPTYTFTSNTENFSLGEIAAPIIAFGDIQAGTVSKALVEYFFTNERLPTELGWSKKPKAITQEDVLRVSEIIKNATSLITDSEPAPEARRRDLHSGFGSK